MLPVYAIKIDDYCLPLLSPEELRPLLSAGAGALTLPEGLVLRLPDTASLGAEDLPVEMLSLAGELPLLAGAALSGVLLRAGGVLIRLRSGVLTDSRAPVGAVPVPYCARLLSGEAVRLLRGEEIFPSLALLRADGEATGFALRGETTGELVRAEELLPLSVLTAAELLREFVLATAGPLSKFFSRVSIALRALAVLVRTADSR